MKPKVVIIGAGGHAKVIIDILKSCGEYEIVGCTSAFGNDKDIDGVSILGDDKILPILFNKGVKHAFIAIGDNKVRKNISENMKILGYQLINVISSFSYIASSAKLGEGIAVMPGAVINAYSRIHDNAIINTGATIDHDNEIESHAHIAPGCNLAGNVKVEEGAFLGVGCRVIPEKIIGKWSIVGAGSVVIRDVENYTKVVGVPARKINYKN
ncbi:acetyltransferase [Ectobacillus funiculus]|uniref:Acetyltransferase n=1 Tax=Ectobacillus funiculus TaxID=137993 RepID=A0ABV5WCZ3_9BACI